MYKKILRRLRIKCEDSERRRKKPKVRLLANSLLTMLCLGFMSGFLGTQCAAEATRPVERPEQAGLFSWKPTVVDKALEDGELFSAMEGQGLNVLYQNFSTDHTRWTTMCEFLERAEQQGIQVYHLTGDPSWANDPKGKSLCEKIEFVASLNRKSARRHPQAAEGQAPRVTGIVFDVEPYSLSEWKRDPDRVMSNFVSGMKEAYQLAQKYNLEVILCVPWHYESKGQLDGLEALIRDGCDAIAVMNYYRGAEIKNIINEVELTQRYGKGLINIYELQSPETHHLEEINTYYYEGLPALWENFDKLLRHYGDDSMYPAIHDYEALKEVLGR